MKKDQKPFSRYNELPDSLADGALTKGCLILEGGAWRGLYTQGALDAMMEAGILLQTVIGVSAGAMSSLAYASGQIGLSARINLKYRHDPQYCGWGAVKKEHGVTGFHYFFRKIIPECGYDWKRISPKRRLVAVATNCFNGKPEYFEYGHCDFEKAVAASATVPYVSRPVVIEKIPYLDGGCSVRIPYQWAQDEGYDKIVIIRTRDRNYRKEEKKTHVLNDLFYSRYPEFKKSLNVSAGEYNICLKRLKADEEKGKIFVQAPEHPVSVSRFESNLEKLGELYEEGYREMKARIPELEKYLSQPESCQTE